MILDGLKTYALQALAIFLGIALLALFIAWLQVKALQAQNETLQLTNANLRDTVEHTERQLVEARKDVARLDQILLEREGSRSAISTHFEGIRRDLRKAIAAADAQVRGCLALRLPPAIADRLRARPGEGDQHGLRAAAGDAAAGLPGARSAD